MKKYIPLFLGIFAVFTVAYSFSSSADTAKLLFFDVNVWIYRAFWGFLGAYMLFKFFTTPKETTENL
ncbi:MAG: hypothetical protein ACR2MS_08010 [Weeksellaceae bacterium]